MFIAPGNVGASAPSWYLGPFPGPSIARSDYHTAATAVDHA
jgi:hypothetical protein